VYATEGDSSQLPIEVHGEILSPSRILDEINVADNEVLLYEIMLQREKDSECPYCLEPATDQVKS